MSDKKPEILTIDDAKNSHYNTIVPYINDKDNQLRFKSPLPLLTNLNTHFGLWESNWNLIHNVDTCTHTGILLMNKLEVLIDGDIDAVYEEIVASIFTNADKVAFLVYERKVRGNAVVSEISPGLVISTIGHLYGNVEFINTATLASNSAPENNFIYYETYMGLPGIAPALIPFANGNVTGNHRHHFVFTEAEVGQTMYVCCFYQITKGDCSPSSHVVSSQII